MNPSPRIRLIIYIVSGVGTIISAYLRAKGLIGDAEQVAWAAFVVFANGLSAANVDTSK